MVVLALVPCCLMFIQFAFGKLVDWIGQDAGASSDEVHGGDSAHTNTDDSFRVSAPTEPFRVDLILAPSGSTTDPNDDGWWMDSPNGRNGRYVRPRNKKKVPVFCDPGS